MIQNDDGSQHCQPLKGVLTPGEKVGTKYEGEFCGYPGTYYDLPRGFPTTDQQAELRLSDPSIPKPILTLIRDNFPLRSVAKQNAASF